MAVFDGTGTTWLTCFDETANQILLTSAQDLEQIKALDEQQFGDIVNAAKLKTFRFKIKAKLEFRSDRMTLNSYVTAVEPVSFTRQATRLIADINKHLDLFCDDL